MSEMSYGIRLLIVFLFFAATFHGLGLAEETSERTAKWYFWPTITMLIREKSTITETIPSSCAVVKQTMPACRKGAKQLLLDPTPTENIERTLAPSLMESATTLIEANDGDMAAARLLQGSESYVPDERRSRVNNTQPLSWAEYFGLGYVTVTKRLVHYVTAKYHNPSTVYSFYVRGCRPSVPPFNLPLCNSSTPTTTTAADNSSNAIVTSHPISSFSKEVHYVP